VIGFLTGKKTVMIPREVSTGTREVNEDYEDRMIKRISECREEKALVVYFIEITGRWYLPSIEEVESTSIPVLSRMQDGVIYGTR